ncbi:MAG TPA: hypothetical protein VHR66_32430 [Gemmataceae bacterium]|nr:hypothetical protein [Gemmataceae bacterium]
MLNLSSLKPLTVREAVIADAWHLALAIANQFPDEAQKPGDVQNRIANALSWTMQPETAPDGFDGRAMFPVLTGLYPQVVGSTYDNLVGQLCEAVADVLAAEVLSR